MGTIAYIMPSMEPKTVVVLKGIKLYWCPAIERQLVEELCKKKYFTKTGRRARACRLCLGLSLLGDKSREWPEPWSSIRG